MFSLISNVLIAIILAVSGIVMLTAPLDTIQKAFPNLASKKAAKIGGAFILLCGIGMIVLLLMDLF